MKLNRFHNPKQFYDRVQNYLLDREARHFSLIRTCNTLINNPKIYKNTYLATVESQENIVAVATINFPYHLKISQVRDVAALEIIARDLYRNFQQIPGVGSFPDNAEFFAKKWQALTGKSYKLKMRTRIHQLEQVENIKCANGSFRPATESDRPLLINWMEAFQMEALGSTQEDIEIIVDRFLAQKSLYLWQDKIPVSMLGGREATPNGASIAPVYTPPEYRRKGYGSAIVAAASQMLLDKGCRYCFLFTDLANPTSNHIYKNIGYQPVCDWNDYRFE